MTSYRHETLPDDSLFEDIKGSEDAIVRMWLRHIPKERIAVLGQDPEIERLEWWRQCFATQSSKRKRKIKKTNKEEPNKEKDEGARKKTEQEKTDDLSTKERFDPKEIVPLGPEDLRTNKEIPPGFNPKLILDLRSKSQDPKEFQTPKAQE